MIRRHVLAAVWAALALTADALGTEHLWVPWEQLGTPKVAP